MSYDKSELEAISLEAIERENVVFISDLIAYIPCSKTTFYELGLNKTDSIKGAISKNKILVKSYLRKQWLNDGNSTLQIALYKLLANEDELARLSGRDAKGDELKNKTLDIKLI